MGFVRIRSQLSLDGFHFILADLMNIMSLCIGVCFKDIFENFIFLELAQ